MATQHGPNTMYLQPCAACGAEAMLADSGRLCPKHNRLWDWVKGSGIHQVVKWAEHFPYGTTACAAVDEGLWTEQEAKDYIRLTAKLVPPIYRQPGKGVSLHIGDRPVETVART